MRAFSILYSLLGFLLGGYYALWQPEILERGFEVTDLAFLLAIRTMISVLLDIPSSFLADRYGHKCIAIVGFFIFSISFLFPTLMTSAQALAITGIGIGVGDAFINGALDSWVADYQKEKEKLLKTIHFFRRDQMQRLGMIAGSLLIPFAVTLFQEPERGTWLIYMGVATTLFIYSFWVPQTDKAEHAFRTRKNLTENFHISNLLSSLKGHPLVWIVFGFIPLGMADGVIEVVFWPKVREMGFNSATAFGLIQASMSFSRILGLELWKRSNLAERESTPALSLYLSGISFIAFALINHPHIAIGVWLLRIVALSAFFSASTALLLRSNPAPTLNATLLSVTSVCNALGSVAATLTIGAITRSNDHLGTLCIVGGILMLVTGGFFWRGVQTLKIILVFKNEQAKLK